MRHAIVLACALCALASPALAGEADVVDITVSREAGGTWRFAVTVRHADEGWDHYADRFEIVGPDGAVLGTRVLAHPHVDEQPFTRSLSGVAIPDNVETVTVRAHDGVHGLGGETIEVTLPR
ncbi:MAG: hypothetical protein ACFE0R_20680 [Salinarimonas sp.]